MNNSSTCGGGDAYNQSAHLAVQQELEEREGLEATRMCPLLLLRILHIPHGTVPHDSMHYSYKCSVVVVS